MCDKARGSGKDIDDISSWLDVETLLVLHHLLTVGLSCMRRCRWNLSWRWYRRHLGEVKVLHDVAELISDGRGALAIAEHNCCRYSSRLYWQITCFDFV